MVLNNWPVCRGHIHTNPDPAKLTNISSKGIIPIDIRSAAGKLTVSGDVVEAFSLQVLVAGIIENPIPILFITVAATAPILGIASFFPSFIARPPLLLPPTFCFTPRALIF